MKETDARIILLERLNCTQGMTFNQVLRACPEVPEKDLHDALYSAIDLGKIKHGPLKGGYITFLLVIEKEEPCEKFSGKGFGI